MGRGKPPTRAELGAMVICLVVDTSAHFAAIPPDVLVAYTCIVAPLGGDPCSLSQSSDAVPGFQFDERQSFVANVKAFLAEMETVDPQMATILRANFVTLATIVRRGERDYE